MGAAVNITTLPTETGTSGLLTVTLSALETAGITKFGVLTFHDAVGDEWQDCAYFFSAQSLGVLSQSASSALAAMTGADLAMLVGITFSTTLSGLTIPANWTKVYLTIKAQVEYPDASSVLQLLITNPANAATDGVVYLNGIIATVITQPYGTLVVNQPAGTVAINVTDEGMALLPIGMYEYDLKCILADGSSTQLSAGGYCSVEYTETRS